MDDSQTIRGMSSRASVRGGPTRAVISQTQGRSVAARVMDRSNSFRHESEGGEGDEIMIEISVGAAAADEEEDVWGEKLWENAGKSR